MISGIPDAGCAKDTVVCLIGRCGHPSVLRATSRQREEGESSAWSYGLWSVV